MYRSLVLSLFALLCLSFSTFANDKPYFHRVKAENGDNITSFLDRYHLADHACNFTQFYELNNMTRQSKLVAEQKYYIPVLIYRYNGVSIRSTLGIDTWQQALRIKKYNEQIKEEKLRRSSMVKSSIMWVPFHELNCVDEATPKTKTLAEATKPAKEEEPPAERPAANEMISPEIIEASNKLSGYRKFPIFGKKHAYVPLKDQKLRNKVFYVVSGHGGPDSGAVGKKGSYQLCEDEYAYDVSLRLVRNLLEHGALVYMIVRDPNDGLRSGEYLPCDRDEYNWGNFKIPRNQKRRLFQRSDAVNELYERHKKQGIKEQTLVTIHIDSNNKSHQTDVFFYHFPGSKAGRSLAKQMQKTLEAKYKKYRRSGKYHGTVTGRDLHMLREPKPTSVFIELGNIRNKFDQQRFILESNRQALANWLYEGLVK